MPAGVSTSFASCSSVAFAKKSSVDLATAARYSRAVATSTGSFAHSSVCMGAGSLIPSLAPQPSRTRSGCCPAAMPLTIMSSDTAMCA